MGQHEAKSTGEGLADSIRGAGGWVHYHLAKVWKAIGGALAASSATILPQIKVIDWTHPQRAAVQALASAVLGALIVYFFPSNQTPPD